ncbi:unnamed protein product [Lepeophtheirus salmonis]|uniref:(salmon louse) hypothetical protein n=1 Tax=Lepeophtheirus salmonis TaxID=72036 RepID=A0A817FF62_LEPSM|nr:unnamed protein product [Lepeophtheirus salmonis]CAG9478061.1 unnamed protein product [Lepeophtheirus salmonis]
MGPAKIIVYDSLALKLLNFYALRESKLHWKYDFLLHTYGGVELQVMGISDPYVKGLDTFTTGDVRKSFITLGQRVPGPKERLALAMSHSNKTGKGVYSVEKDHRV